MTTTTKPPTTSREAIVILQDTITKQIAKCDPEGDINPLGFTLSKSGNLCAFAVDPRFMATPVSKDILAGMFAGLVLRESAPFFLFACPVWGAQIAVEKGETPEQARNRFPQDFSEGDFDGRVEFIMIWVVTSSESYHLHARIQRHKGSAPSLGPWERMEDRDRHKDGKTDYDRFLQPVQTAMHYAGTTVAG